MYQWIRNIGELYDFKSFAQSGGRRAQFEGLKGKKSSSILCLDHRIVCVGTDRAIEKYLKTLSAPLKTKLKEVSAGGANVYPGFVECHSHLIFAGERASEFEKKMSGVTYQQIAREGGGILSTVKNTRQASTQKLTQLGEARLKRFRDQGVVLVEAKSGYALSMAQERRVLKLQSQLKGLPVVSTFLGAHALPPEYSDAKLYLMDLLKLASKIFKNREAQRADIFIEEGFFDVNLADWYIKELQKIGFAIAIHADQLSRQGAVQLGLQLNVQSVDHAIQLNKNDIKGLCSSETTAVLLPTADFYMKCSYPKARELIDGGARVALATDFNPGTSPTQDLAFVGLLARMEMKMKLHEVWCAYTVGAAYALGVQDSYGSIEAGKEASLFLSDAHPSDFFYSVGHHPVNATLVRGKWFKSTQ